MNYLNGILRGLKGFKVLYRYLKEFKGIINDFKGLRHFEGFEGGFKDFNGI